jgi:hypothetical protein
MAKQRAVLPQKERKIMRRIQPETGVVFLPHRYRDGKFRVADPLLGNSKKLAENQIPVSTTEELLTYVRRGFAVRMRSNSTPRQYNLINASEIEY